jgi:hypothetical protein
MVRKSDEERLRELEEQMEKMKARKQQIQSRLSQKERKARTKRLIEVGAIFEKHFEIEGQEQAEKIALMLKNYVAKHKKKFLSMPIEEIKEQNKQPGESKHEEAFVQL